MSRKQQRILAGLALAASAFTSVAVTAAGPSTTGKRMSGRVGKESPRIRATKPGIRATKPGIRATDKPQLRVQPRALQPRVDQPDGVAPSPGIRMSNPPAQPGIRMAPRKAK